MSAPTETESFDPEDALALDNQLCFALYTASRLMTRAYRPLLTELGLTYPQYLVLLVLWEEAGAGRPAPSVRELGERLYLDSGTLTPLLKRMESEGLLERRRSEVDERVLRVSLSERGSALKERALEIPLELLCRIDAAPASLIALRDEIRGLLDTLAKTTDEPA